MRIRSRGLHLLAPFPPSGGNDKGRSSSPDFQKGIEDILKGYKFSGEYYNIGLDSSTWGFVDVSDVYTNQDGELLRNGFNQRYYVRFQTEYGIVRISADYLQEPGNGTIPSLALS